MAERELFPNNSNRAMRERTEALEKPHTEVKSERKHGTQIAKRNTAVVVKDGRFKRLVKMFLADDVDDVGEYLVKDLIIPGVKDVFFNFLWAVFWGDRRVGGNGGKLDGNRQRYNNISNTARVRNTSSIRNRTSDNSNGQEENGFRSGMPDVENIIVGTKAEADDIKKALLGYYDDYSETGVPIGYLMECLGESCDWASAENVGWKYLDERGIRIVPVNGGLWRIVLPRPQRLS